MTRWPYTTRVEHGIHHTGPWLPWRCDMVRAAAAVVWVVTVGVLSGSALLAGIAAGLACWAWRAAH
ncbi:MAG TPA: hypothetical protein VFX70_07540 [Mycobacteriales bacterium]|nr:hypothetical protein [Mycobacteriales bacterium]